MFGRAIQVFILGLLIGAWPGYGQGRPGGAAAGESGRRTVLILGDSLAAGFGVEPEAAFPARLQSKIDSRDLPFSIVNAGVSGDTSAGGLRRINWLLRRPVEVLLLELGGNDGLRGIPPVSTRSNLQQIIERTREKNPRVKIIIAGMRMPANMGEDFTREFAEAFADLARVNRATLIPFLLEGVGGDPELNQPDLIHPNAEGHRMVAEHVWRTLEPILGQFAEGAKNPAPTIETSE